jgi:mRNA interferase HigB
MLVKRAAWKNRPETKADFPTADLVGRRTVFNIKGNSYRLIARVNYRTQRVFILHILTHAEYVKGNWKQ